MKALHGITIARCLSVVLMALALGACRDRQGFLPKSGGRTYEVLVVADREGIVARALSTPVEALPQAEPSFDVSTVDSAGFNASLQLARSIVVVSIDPDLYTTTRIHYEKNVYARPQMVAYIGSPSIAVLRRDIGRHGAMLRRLLERFETNATIARMEGHRNTEAEQMVKEMFGVEMKIPMDFTASKRGKDFLWLSNNSPTAMQNIVVYRARPARSVAEFVAQRDSAMGRNIKGETDSMEMTTVAATTRGTKTKERGREVDVYRGLWEMRGDAMGGPFVSHTVGNVTAEAFVFAPGNKKRNYLRQAEAALYTLK